MPDLGSLNAVDYGIIALLLVSGYFAAQRGLARELLALVGWAAAVYAGILLNPWLADRYGDFLGDGRAAGIIGFALVFLAAAAVWKLFSRQLATGFAAVAIGRLDALLGFLFGLLRGALVVVFVYLAAVYLLEGEDRFPGAATSSASIVPTRAMASQVVGLAPFYVRLGMSGRIPGAASGNGPGSLLSDEQGPAPGVKE